MWPAMRFGVQMRYLVEIELLIFSDTYMSLKYACELLVQYLEQFLRYRLKFTDPYIMEFYAKCWDVNVNFLIGNAGNSLLNTWPVSSEMISPKSIIIISRLHHFKMVIFVNKKNHY